MLWIAAVAGLAAGAWLWRRPPPPIPAPRAAPVAGVASAAAVASTVPPGAEAAASPSEAFAPLKDKPAALTPREWAVVRARAAAASRPDAEAARMADYIAFQKVYLEWRSLARGQDPARRDDLGQQLLDGLPAHVQQGSVALEQARTIQDEVLAARVPDDAQRAPLLEAERQRLPAQPAVAAFPQ